MITLLRLLVVLSLSVSAATTAETPNTDPSPDAESKAILERVKKFYSWVLLNDRPVTTLEPRIKNVNRSSRFYLDISTLPAFSAAFVKSGQFSPDFPGKLEKYYTSHKNAFSLYSQKQFDQLQKDGRGPLMNTEDKDIFFCAQEYEYAPSYVDGMTLSDLKVSDKIASAIVVSPYNWKTEFQFRKVDGRWLISAYCEYK